MKTRMRLAALSLLLLLAACGGSATINEPGDSGSNGGDSGTQTLDDGGSSGGPDAGGHDAGPADAGFPDAGPPPELVSVVYAHGPNELYKLDPATKAVTRIGAFQGCSSVIDLALDENSNAFVTTFSGVYSLDLATAKCVLIKAGSYPNSLSFIPKGTLDPNSEALVGYFGANYVRIDPQTGAMQDIGALSGGYASSGDIVSVKDGGTFLTVKGNGCTDCLFQVDPKTGGLIKNFGTIRHADVFGLAYWAGALYGFDDSGALFEISAKGSGIGTSDIHLPNGAGLQWWGAGSTTSAPVRDADGGSIEIN